jgi:hypothetical protein
MERRKDHMKVNGLMFGIARFEDQRVVPGMGRVHEVYVGQRIKQHRGYITISDIDFNVNNGLVRIRSVDAEGKPNRVWSTNENVEPRWLADFIVIQVGPGVAVFGDDEKAQKQADPPPAPPVAKGK